jgi:hypothetical protein
MGARHSTPDGNQQSDRRARQQAATDQLGNVEILAALRWQLARTLDPLRLTSVVHSCPLEDSIQTNSRLLSNSRRCGQAQWTSGPREARTFGWLRAGGLLGDGDRSAASPTDRPRWGWRGSEWEKALSSELPWQPSSRPTGVSPIVLGLRSTNAGSTLKGSRLKRASLSDQGTRVYTKVSTTR